MAVHYAEFEDENGETVVFDPTERSERYRFSPPDVVASGGGARPAVHLFERDMNGDGVDDLVPVFEAHEAGFTTGDTRAMLYWERDETGEHGLAGADSVRVVG